MPRSERLFRLLLATVALATGACSREKKPAPDAGTPVAAGAVLASFDALAPGAHSGYRDRTLARLGTAKPAMHETLAAMPAGLTLRVAWETRDDFAFVRRYLTWWKVTVESIAPGTSCVVSRTQPLAPKPVESIDSLRITLSIDYVCTEGRNTSNLGVVIGNLDEETGFTQVGLATGALRPAPITAAPLALSVVHFTPKSHALDDAAKTVLDEYVNVLRADASLGLCLGYRTQTSDAVQAKRREAVRGYIAEHGIARTRVPEAVGTGQAPPADDDIELYPFDVACLGDGVARAKRR